MNNKGPVINGDQLINLINSVISNVLINIDTQSISKDTLLRKFQLIKENLDILMDRTRERVFNFNKETKKISFFVGEHTRAYLNLSVSFLFISDSNPNINKELTVNIPKSLFSRFLNSKEPIINPSYSIISSNELNTNLFFRVITYRDSSGQPLRTLEFDMNDEDLSIYDDIKVVVNTLALEFKEIQTKGLTEQTEHVKRTKINQQVNIGYYPYVKDDGTIVKSDIIRTITSKTNEQMQSIISGNTFNPSEFTVVPIEEDTSNRVLNIRIQTKEANTEVFLTQNTSQSKIYKVNWGDSETTHKVKHKFSNPGTYDIKVYNRLDDFKLSASSEIDLLGLEVPNLYLSPLEWNNTLIESIFDFSQVKIKLSKFPGRLFENANNVLILRSLVKSDTITSVDPLVFKGLSILKELEVGDLFKNITSIDSTIFNHIPRIKKMTHVFLNSKLNTLPTGLLDELEDLEDITSFAENSKITNLPLTLVDRNYSLKILKSAFKNIPTLTQDVTDFLSNLLEIEGLTSLESMFESTPVNITLNEEIIKKFNKQYNLASLASTFKSTNIQNNTLAFTLSNIDSLVSIESMFEGCTNFKVNAPLLQSVSNPSFIPIKVNNCLKGTTKVLISLTRDDDLFIDTDYNGASGLFE